MKYYLNTVEQIVGSEEGTYSEYSKSEKQTDFQTAKTNFFDKCKNVNADLGKGHTFMAITIEDSNKNVVKKEILGEYVESEA